MTSAFFLERPQSLAEAVEKTLSFITTRRNSWDGLDSKIYNQDLLVQWPLATQEEKNQALMRCLGETEVALWMIPEVTAVPASAVFDLFDHQRSFRFTSRSRCPTNRRQSLLPLARALLERGADPNHIGLFSLIGETFSVMERCLSGTSFVEPEKTVEWLNLLISAGADPSLQGNPNHGPPIELALRLSSPQPLWCLLEAGANPADAKLLDRREPLIQRSFKAWERQKRLSDCLVPSPASGLSSKVRL